MQKRVWILYAAMFTVFGLLAFRIYTLSDQYLASAAGEQASITVTAAITRGTIYDRNGTPLVNDTNTFSACIIQDEGVITELSSVLTKEALSDVSTSLQSGKPIVIQLYKPVLTKGITLFQIPVRYNDRVLAPHVIGYMDAGQTEGLSGIEQAFNSLLSSYTGQAEVTYTVDAHGRALGGVFPQINNTTNRSVGGVQLTIDADIQRAAEDITSKYVKKGAVVVLDAEDGDILAMASFPQFQPNTVADVLQNEDSPLLNRVLCSYNCGSVFKIVSAATALQNGKETAQMYTCNGSVDVGGTVFRCHQRLGHGTTNMLDAFKGSCNCYFIELMQSVGGDALWQLAQQLQFNDRITLTDGIATKQATLPTKAALVSPAVLANLSFGQGELTASPLHIAQLVCTVLNDGNLTAPRLIKGYVDEEGTFTASPSSSVQKQVFSAQTARTIKSMMAGVLEEDGTGHNGKPLFGTAGAKTGTAETGWLPAENETHDVVQSWFAGYYIVNDKRYVIVVLGENADNTDAKTALAFKGIAEYLYNKS